jgi:HAD superfamily hydrolase (TIGR01490 family)
VTETELDNHIAAFFDLDGTLTTVRVWRGIMDYFVARSERRWTHRRFLAYHLPLYVLHRIGLLNEADFRAQWAGHLAWYLKGYSIQQGESVWDWVVDTFLRECWRLEALSLVESHLERGDIVVLVSSSPAPLLRRAANSLGVEHTVGTRFSVKNGFYNGGISGPVCINHYKRKLVEAYLDDIGMITDFASSFSYADSISDLPVLEMVGNPVATFPERTLAEVAHQRGWEIFPKD